MAVEVTEREVGVIPLGDSTRLTVRVIEGDDEPRIDVRKWVTGARYEGPTKQGIRLTFDQADWLAGVLSDLIRKAKAEG